MKRWIPVLCLLLISVLGIVGPAGAQASAATTGKLTSGKPVKVSISKPGQRVNYTFAATANKNVTFDITRFHFTNGGSSGEVFIDFYEPGSTSVYTGCNSGVVSNTYCNFTTPIGGTWKVAVIPFQSSVGSLTLTFANDVPTKALTPGTPVTTTIKFAGQQAGYTFAATANKNVAFKITGFHFSQPGGPNEVFLDFYEPGSTSVYTSCAVVANTTCPVKTPVRGTWNIALMPFQANTGSLTIKLT